MRATSNAAERGRRRHLFAGALVLLSACQCGQRVAELRLEPLVLPERVELPRTWVGFPTARAIEVTNPGRTERPLELEVPEPFGVQPSLSLAPGETVSVTLRFGPSDGGTYEATLMVLDVETGSRHEVHLSAIAERPPPCPPDEACRSFAFDPIAGLCSAGNRANGSACATPLACFASAQCRDGACVGASVTCDDGDRCTLDTCSDVGCGNVDATPYCPPSTNPCLVQACTRESGCGLAALPDGTSCGERTCSNARVCIEGSCVDRTPPKVQACLELILGVPAGNASVDGRGSEARFEDVSSLATQGIDTMFSEGTRLRLIRGRDVTTIAGRHRTPGLVDGAGSAVRLSSPTVAVSPRPGTFFVGDGSAVRLATTQGLVVTIAGGPDAGVRDGVGAAALLHVSSPIRSIGATAQFAQHARITRIDRRVFVRQVSFTGEVRTLREIDLTSLPGVRSGQDYSISSALTDSDKPQPQVTIMLTPLGSTPAPSLAFFVDGDAGVQAVTSGRRWERGDAGITWDLACRFTWPSSAMVVSCNRLPGVEENGVAWTLQGPTLYRVLPPVIGEAVAGPIPDRRVVDGDRDGGRLASPARLSAWGDRLLVVDQENVDWLKERVRVVRRNVPDVVTIDAGFGRALAAGFDGGVLVLDETGNLSLFDDRLSLVSRRSIPALRDPAFVTSAPDGIDVFRGRQVVHVSAGGVASPPIEFASWSGPLVKPQPRGSSWFVMGQPPDGGAAELQEWFQDGGVTTVGELRISRPGFAPQGFAVIGGDVYSLAGTAVIRSRAGTVSTLLELSDTPNDLIALDDGSLVVAVQSALLRIVP